MLAKLAEAGHSKDEILHTAQSLFHDHAPANDFGIASAWIDRRHEQEGWGATQPAEAAHYDFRFMSLADMVEAHRKALGQDRS